MKKNRSVLTVFAFHSVAITCIFERYAKNKKPKSAVIVWKSEFSSEVLFTKSPVNNAYIYVLMTTPLVTIEVKKKLLTLKQT